MTSTPPSHLVLRAAAERGLAAFHRKAWAIYEPGTPLVKNWHIDAMCDFSQAFFEGTLTSNFVVVSVPPGSGKSSVCGISLPAWGWARDPSFRWLCGSYDVTLLQTQSTKTVAVMQDPDYLAAFPNTRLQSPKPAMTRFTLVGGGERVNTSPGGRGTGRHAHAAVVDDPLKAGDAHSDAALDKAREWITTTLPSRGAVPNEFRIMLVMQRLSLKDPAELYLQQDGVEHLMLPMEYVPGAFWDRGTSLGSLDPRTEPGELLFPSRWAEKKVKAMQAELGPEADAQLQQNPVPREGGIVPESTMRFEWVEVPARARLVQSWDFSAKGTDTAHSRTAAGLFASGTCQECHELLNSIQERQRGAKPERRLIEIPKTRRYFLVDYRVKHLTYPQGKALFTQLWKDELWSRAKVKLVEEAASGVQLIAELSSTVPGIRAVKPKDSKEQRLRVHSDVFGTGLVLMPPVERLVKLKDRVEIDDYRLEMANFPRGQYDDLVDITSQALDCLVSKHQRAIDGLGKLSQQAQSLTGKRWRRVR